MSYAAVMAQATVMTVLVVAWLWRPASDRDVEVFCRCHGVEQRSATRRLVHRHLTRQRRLRATLGGAAFLLPGLATWVVTGDAERAHGAGQSWTGLLVGVMAGTLAGELTVHRPGLEGEGRRALLARRRLADYLTWRLRWGPVVAGLAAGACWVAVARLSGPASARPSATDVAFGLSVAAIPALALVAAWWIVRRPQPLASPEALVLDDALRAASARALAAVATTLALVDLAGGLMAFTRPADGPGDIVVATAVAVTAVAAVLAWESRNLWGPVRRLGARPGPFPGSPLPPVPPAPHVGPA